MTEIERRDRLIGWLGIIFGDVQHLILYDHLFWEFQGVVARNDEFLEASGLFTQSIAVSYVESAVLDVRRQSKSNKDSISMVRFLEEVRDHPAMVSRAHYIGLYGGKENWHIQIGQHDFDRVSGEGSTHFPPSIADQQISDVKRAAEGLEHYADRRVAHYDRRELSRPIPKFSELTDALTVLEGLVILYWRLLKGPSMTTLLPTILYDWKDIFRFAWEPASPRAATPGAP